MPTSDSTLGSWLRWPIRRSNRLRYLLATLRGRPAGDVRYVFDPSPPPPPSLEVRLPATGPRAVDPAAARAWCARQTLPELAAVGLDSDGHELWRVGDSSVQSPAWFAAPGGLPELLPVHLESCLLLAAAEAVDAVALRERVEPPLDPVSPAELTIPPLRPFALFTTAAYRYEPAADAVIPLKHRLIVKYVDTTGVANLPRSGQTYTRRRRGPYLTSFDPGPLLEVGVRDASRLDRRPRPGTRPVVLAAVSFLAHGGVEHVLHETLAALRNRFDLAFVTLAPHRPEVGDRRPHFRNLSERLYCLGDLVHPAAMYGMLAALIDSLAADVFFNANGTTVFYEWVARLKAERPRLRIVDHLYDHQVGYIEQYRQRPELQASIDSVVAVNHRIARVLCDGLGWPAERVPVIWPCGRPRDAFPPLGEREAVRAAVRRELGLAPQDVVFLTAARMHPQKRPLDLVALAERVRDLDQVQFLLVGGGELESRVDAAIAASRARIRRLPFRSDIPRLVVAADVGCLVSGFEGLPVFILECFQAVRPLLGTNVGDMGRVLTDSGAGLVVETPGDLDRLAAAVRQLADPIERARLSERAAAAGELCDVETCAERYADVFAGTGGECA